MTLKDLFNEEETGMRHQPSQPQLEGPGTEALGSGDEEDDTNSLGRDDSTDDEERGNMPSERFLDRMIKVRGIPKPKLGAKDPGYLMDPDFAEQYILNSFSEKEQRQLWRRMMDIIHLAQGDGNEELVKSDSASFAFRVMSHRARNDTALEANERLMWIENRQTSKQVIKTQQNNTRPASFLQRLFGR